MKLRFTLAALAIALSPALAAQDAAPTPPADAAAAVAAPVDPMQALAAAMEELKATVPGDAAAGATKAMACAACHGADGNSQDPQYPKIAGQNESFIARQLTLLKVGARPSPVMQPFAMTLNAQDMRDIGAHFATQTAQAGLADESLIEDANSPYVGMRIVDVGQKIFQGGVPARQVPACMSCHGPAGHGMAESGYPAIGGQHSSYVQRILAGYKAAPATAPEQSDALFALMSTVSSRLTDEEILAVSSYVEGLHAR